MSEHGHCPKCGVDLDGGDIVEFFLGQGYSHKKALATAKHYGYREGHTQFGRVIGIERDHDCIEAWKCPDCGHEWPRDFNVGRV